MVIPEQIIDGVTVFSPKGKLLSTVDYEEFRNRIHKLKVPPIRGVVFDMSGVDFINSSGVSMLIAGLKILREADRDLRLAGMSPIAQKVIVKVCGLGEVFEIYDSVGQAVASFEA
ncbi:MAG: STAS domain-containing protein [Candidatus Latescibacteria bacterium]|jgi:anti-sigma B factor antagonist|nr:STAS domain-containing protein [Candidatus Latescibacterota bacterium]